MRDVSGTSHDRLSSPAWLLNGLFRRRLGILVLEGGRITFSTREGQVFDVPLTSLSAVRFPWYYFGGGVILTAAGQSYRLSFVEPGDQGDLAGGREVGRLWRSIFIAAGLLKGKSGDV